MEFDNQGHIIWTPTEVFDFAKANPIRLVDRYLMNGTPRAFPTYQSFGDFLEAISERTGVHPRNLYVRGSCHIGFSIAPRPKVWTAMRSDPNAKPSDLDLVIVDQAYFTRFEREIHWWEDRNVNGFLRGRAATNFERRQQDRQFNLCRDEALPGSICIHHQDTMRQVAALNLCGLHRPLSAFIYPDWLSARNRYLFDLNELVKAVEAGRLPNPSDEPVVE